MSGCDCFTCTVRNTNADSHSYSHGHTDGDTDGFAHTYADTDSEPHAYTNRYAYTLRQRDNPKRRFRDGQLPTLGNPGPERDACCNQHAGTQRDLLRIRGRRTR
jgi:hypothetical protein